MSDRASHRVADAAPRPLYSRVLRLRHVQPSGLLRFLFLEGMIFAAVILSLAEFVSWWSVLVFPVAAALMVKINDLIAGLIARAVSNQPSRSKKVVGRAVARATVPVRGGNGVGDGVPVAGRRRAPVQSTDVGADKPWVGGRAATQAPGWTAVTGRDPAAPARAVARVGVPRDANPGASGRAPTDVMGVAPTSGVYGAPANAAANSPAPAPEATPSMVPAARTDSDEPARFDTGATMPTEGFAGGAGGTVVNAGPTAAEPSAARGAAEPPPAAYQAPAEAPTAPYRVVAEASAATYGAPGSISGPPTGTGPYSGGKLANGVGNTYGSPTGGAASDGSLPWPGFDLGINAPTGTHGADLTDREDEGRDSGIGHPSDTQRNATSGAVRAAGTTYGRAIGGASEVDPADGEEERWRDAG